MTLNRRHVLTGIGIAAAAGIAVAGAPLPAQAGDSRLRDKKDKAKQVAGIYRTTVGQVRITPVFDGGMEMGAAIVLDPQESEISLLKQAAFVESEVIPGYLNCFVVESDGKTRLIDTGAGDYGKDTGHLQENLQKAGFSINNIDEILLTHAHPDHVKGLLGPDGAIIFKGAVVRISTAELDFWFSDAEKAKKPGAAAAFDTARQYLEPYRKAGRLKTFSPGAAISPTILSVDLKGHTPGHSGFRIRDGGEELLIWGDIVHMQILQFAHPEWALTFDIDPDQAIATRKAILAEVTRDRVRVAGMHLGFPGLGHVVKAGDAYAFAPQMWEAVL